MLELQARNPFPSTPVAAEKYADRMGGEAWKRIKEDLEALGRRVEQTGEFGAAVIVGPPGSGKTHVCMNFLKGSPSLFPIYVDASRGRDLKEEALESAEASARRLGYAGLSDYLSAFAYGYARKRAGDKKFEAELEYGLRDRLFHSSYDGYLRALRDRKIYLTRRASFLLRLIAGQVRPSDFEELLALIETLSKEMGMRVALVVDETGEEYERELKSLYNRQPSGLLLITTFVPDRWAAIKDKALKDRFYSASVFRQLGYPKQEDLVDIVMSYARDVPGLNRELVAAAIQKGGMSDIRDTLRKFHDAFESCRGNPPCMLEALTSVTGDNGELSRAVERYMRWQVLPELKERGLISYFSDKGKKIQSLSSVLDLVFATENTLFLGDVKVSDQDIYLDEDINVMKASKVEGIELNGKVYKDIRPFLVTNAKVGNDIPVVYITPDEITSILAGFSPPSVGEKMERLVRSRTVGPSGPKPISHPKKTANPRGFAWPKAYQLLAGPRMKLLRFMLAAAVLALCFGSLAGLQGRAAFTSRPLNSTSMVLVSPTSGYSYVLGYLGASIASDGMSVRVQAVPWASFYTMAYYPPQSGVYSHPNFSQGGYDAYVLATQMSALPNPMSSAYPYFNGTDAGLLAAAYERTGNATYLSGWAKTVTSQLYQIPLFYVDPLWVVPVSLKGLNPSSPYQETSVWSGVSNLTVLSMGPAPGSLLPLYGSGGLVADSIFQPLVVPRGTGYAYCLARSAVSNPSYTVWNVTLQPNVTFQNGQPMDSDDVVASVMAGLNEASGSQAGPFFRFVLGDQVEFKLLNGTVWFSNSTSLAVQGEVVATSPTSVEFVLPSPYRMFYPQFLSQVYVYPLQYVSPRELLNLPSSVFSTGGPSGGPVGTGPYELVQRKGSQFILRRYSGYWNGTPGLQYLAVRYSQVTPSQALSLLRAGKVQALSSSLWLYHAYGQALPPGYSWSVGKPDILVYMVLNPSNPVWGTGSSIPYSSINPSSESAYALEFRQAVSDLIPRAYLCQALFSGLAEPASSIIVPTQASYLGLELPSPLPFDPNFSILALRALGYSCYHSPLAATAWPSAIYQGGEVQVVGYALFNREGFGNQTLQLQVGQGKSYSLLQDVKTLPNGTISLSVTLSQTGNFYLRLYFPGAILAGKALPPAASSPIGPISVSNYILSNSIYISVAIVGVLLALLVVTKYAMARRRGSLRNVPKLQRRAAVQRT